MLLFWNNNPVNILCAQSRQTETIWKTDTSQHVIPLSGFKALLPRDAIAPIDSPEFVEQKLALKMYYDQEPVIVVKNGSSAKAYPLSILIWHEIVNDAIEDKKISITYCPLCNAAIVFAREMPWHGKHLVLDFGTSGMLRKSDLVMWDRQTESWWQQIEGKALVGSLSGARLAFIPSQIMSLKDFIDRYPDGLILSNNTGFDAEYGQNPYENYDHIDNQKPFLFEDNIDPRLPAMERLIAVSWNGNHKAYSWSDIQEMKVINDTFERQSLVIFYRPGAISVLDSKDIRSAKQTGTANVFNPLSDGILLHFKSSKNGFIDLETHSYWDYSGQCIGGKMKGKELIPYFFTNHFAFAYLAFFPGTIIYHQ